MKNETRFKRKGQRAGGGPLALLASARIARPLQVRCLLAVSGLLLCLIGPAAQPASAETWAEQTVSLEATGFVTSVTDVELDAGGNVYVSGFAQVDATFGPFHPPLSDGKAFVAKLDRHGNWVWVRRAGNNISSGLTISGVAVDANQNVYLAGDYAGSAQVAGLTLPSAATRTIFVAKLDRDGNGVWTRLAGGSAGNNDRSRGIALDGSGNLYIAGGFAGSAVEFGSTVLSSKGTLDLFVASLDSEGEWLWARGGGGANFEQAVDISVDPSGPFVYVMGDLRSPSGTFGGITLTRGSGNSEAIALKLSASGNWLWGWQTVSSISHLNPTAVAAHPTGIYLTGDYNDTASGTVDFGDGTPRTEDNGELFLVKLSPGDGSVDWVRTSSGSGQATPEAVAIDSFGDVWVTGSVSGDNQFGNDTVSTSNTDLLILRLDELGNWQNLRTAGGADGDQASAVAVHSSGIATIAGLFTGTTTFGDRTLSTINHTEGFIVQTRPLSWVERHSVTVAAEGLPVCVTPSGFAPPLGTSYRVEESIEFTAPAKFVNDGRYEIASSDTPLAIPAGGALVSQIDVSMPPTGPASITDVDAELDVTFSGVEDLQANLRHIGSGDVNLGIADLFTFGDALGDDFTGTVFDDEAGLALAGGSAPYTGAFTTTGTNPMSVFDSESSDGAWVLDIENDDLVTTGTLEGWKLSFECDGAEYAPLGWKDGSGNILPTGDGNSIPVHLTQPSELTWVIERIPVYEVGEPIEPPAQAKLLAPAVEPASESGVFFWSPVDKKLYGLRPTQQITLVWQKSDGSGTLQRDLKVIWPEEPVLHIAGAAPVALEPEGSSKRFSLLQYSTSSSAQIDGSKRFSAGTAGFSVLHFTEGPTGNVLSEPTLFEVVRTVTWDTIDPQTGLYEYLVDSQACTIGTKLTDADHDDPGKTGYVYFEQARYDGVGTQRAYDRENRTGAIIPVNRDLPGVEDDMLVLWYRPSPATGIRWPQKPVRYQCVWPADPDKIVIASERGSEVLEQPLLDAATYRSMQVYNQPDSALPGFNPNDEHALLQPSAQAVGAQVLHALRSDITCNFDCNPPGTFAQPYVLLKYFSDNGTPADPDDDEWAHKVYQVLDRGFGFDSFEYTEVAGTRLFPPQPLNTLGDCPATSGEGEPFYKDHKGGVWARAAGTVEASYHYPLQAGFYWDLDSDGAADAPTGTCVPWLDRLPGGTPGSPVPVTYDVEWPAEPLSLVVGETLLEAKRGLPDIQNQAAVAVAYENQDSAPAAGNAPTRLVRLYSPLDAHHVTLAILPADVSSDPVSGAILGSSDGSVQLNAPLSERFSYDELGQRLQLVGLFDDSAGNEPLLVPNVLTPAEREQLLSLSTDPDWQEAIEAIYVQSRNPNAVDLDDDNVADPDLHIGAAEDPFDLAANVLQQAPAVGPGLALTAGLAQDTGFVTLVFNDDPSLGAAPVSMQVVRVGCLPGTGGPFPGELKVVEPGNVFDEEITMRLSGDFAGDPSAFEFEWYLAPDVNGGQSPTPLPGEIGSPWRKIDPPVAPAQGAVQVTIQGAAAETIRDNWFLARFRGYGVCGNDTTFSAYAGSPASTPLEPLGMFAPGWVKRVLSAINPFEQRVRDFHQSEGVNFASMIGLLGARYEGDVALSSDPGAINQIGLIETYETVLRRARSLTIDEGIEDQAANTALLLAAGRLSEFSMLLANEAYADATDPTIGFTSGSEEYGSAAPAVFTFQNQVASLLEEELALLRGRDRHGSRPFYNHLIWNFTTGEGEVAYQQAYNITDQNLDGFVDEHDARTLFPQGHGDAWGHYLTAVKAYYQLLRHPSYTWLPRGEAVLVAGNPVQVDFRDERKFAAAVAAKARTGAEILDLTYRQYYTEDADGQWQGYKDPDTDRAWGASGWARRAGQGAYFDWAVANAILPEQYQPLECLPELVQPDGSCPRPSAEGLEIIDRTTVTELLDIGGEVEAIQAQLDEADAGLNPLGLAKNVVPFDINPAEVDDLIFGRTHFEQVYDRALEAMASALVVFDHANQLTNMIRRNQDTVDQFATNAVETERDFRNRLIEIFGTPYPDDIGPGGTFPTGYAGPDLYHYAIVDRSELTGSTAAAQVTELTAYFSPMPGVGFYPDDPDAGTPLDGVSDLVKEVKYSRSLDGFGIVKPTSWNQASRRTSIGEIQLALSELYQARARYEQGLKSYGNLLEQIKDGALSLEERFQLRADKLEAHGWNLGVQVTLSTVITATETAQSIFEQQAEKAVYLGEVAAEALPSALDDVLAPARGAFKLTGLLASTGFQTFANISGVAANLAAQGKELTELTTELNLVTFEENFEVQQAVRELEQLVREEPVQRLELFLLLEAMEQSKAQYRNAVADGGRLLEDLVAFRTISAGDTQVTRYRDMAFRIFRNDALQKYRAQFDLAARYAFLAATAYDYETNLIGTAGAAGARFLTDIVRHRSLGQVLDGIPVAGSRGLADALARMKQNYDVLKGQFGFNNPQTETNRFSLRKELFRTFKDGDSVAGEVIELADADWRSQLETVRVANLWAIPEFRRSMRPFAPESSGPQPGIVLRFPTTVTFGQNFFGWPLGGGDSAYDPTNFVTKVRSVGVWLEGYDGAGLSNTPRVYLVPVGMDVLRSSSSADFSTREWKVLDQALPVPFPIGQSDLSDPDWIPIRDGLNEGFATPRKFNSFRAYHDSGEFDPAETVTESRLVGRSVWNTEWVLVIPGGTLLSDADAGLNTLIYGQPAEGTGIFDPAGVERDGAGISDIKIFFQTYAYSGARRTASASSSEPEQPLRNPARSPSAEAAVARLLLAQAGMDFIPEPDAVYHGTASRRGTALTSGTVAARFGHGADPLASYLLGSVPEYGDRYALRVPLQAFATGAGDAAWPGAVTRLFLDDELAATDPIDARGSVERIDLDPDVLRTLNAGGSVSFDGAAVGERTLERRVQVAGASHLLFSFGLSAPAGEGCSAQFVLVRPDGQAAGTFPLTETSSIVEQPARDGVWTLRVVLSGTCAGETAFRLGVSDGAPTVPAVEMLLLAAAAGLAAFGRLRRRRR